MNDESLWEFLLLRLPDIGKALLEHIILSATSMAMGCAIAIPLAVLLVGNRIRWVNSIVFTLANILQTVPSLALLAILIPLLGIGTQPAIMALFLYSLMPLLRNTYAGFQAIDPALIEAARGMGYNASQRIFRIQLPLSFPYIMSGVRVTTVYIINWATLATLIGGGGLGQLIMSGLAVNRSELILTGALLSILLALAADFLLARVEKTVANRVNVNTVSDQP
ncbi:ABC transporter permease [Paenibacillus senegalensis]|uniref:ABC transporter permease n=1 Tax=Paenibacillus senegalensis TaxID=1465766 RepID=UPI000289D381|nr:ABC transporter permease [Paenibacillus senegalensis]